MTIQSINAYTPSRPSDPSLDRVWATRKQVDDLQRHLHQLRKEVQEKVFEFYENEHESNSHLGERLIMLRKGGLANIFDYLEMHPSGDINNRRDPVWENI